MDWAKTTPRQYENHWSFVIWCDFNWGFYSIHLHVRGCCNQVWWAMNDLLAVLAVLSYEWFIAWFYCHEWIEQNVSDREWQRFMKILKIEAWTKWFTFADKVCNCVYWNKHFHIDSNFAAVCSSNINILGVCNIDKKDNIDTVQTEWIILKQDTVFSYMTGW